VIASIAIFACVALVAFVVRDVVLRLDRSKRETLATADMVAVAAEVKTLTAALIKHEERLSAVEVTVSPSLRRR